MAGMDDVQERTITRNGGTLHLITAANAREMQARSAASRRNKAAQAARNRVTARLAAVDPTVQSVYDAWGVLVADQAEALRQAASEGKPRADDMIQIGRAMGLIAQPHEREQEQGGATATLTLSPDMVALLAEVARVQRGGAATEADGLVGGGGDG